jgi:WD40 repeat protein/predicted Ser/Thr protein kinase
VIADKYKLRRVLGRGGMGVVYLAWQANLERLVALKMLTGSDHASPEARERFLIEAKAVASLKHPHIVTLHDWGEERGLPYFSMEYVAGTTLAARLRDGPLAPVQAAELVQKVALAVAHAHAQGIVHRDLKPSNVLLGPDGEPKVTDFGLAKRLDQEDGPSRSGQVLGTPGYLAPEQADSKLGPVGKPSDGSGLGAVLYHTITGRPPFLPGVSTEETLRLVLTTDPVPVRRLNPVVPRDLETICLKCLEKEPGRRYAGAEVVADELGRWLEGRPIVARPAGRVETLWKWCRRHPALATVIVLSTLMLAAGLLLVESVRQAEEAAMALRQRRTAGLLTAAEGEFRSNAPHRALLFLAQALRADPGAAVPAQRVLNALTHRAFPVPVGRLSAPSNRIVATRFSPDGRKILTACYEGELQVWDAASYQPLTRPWSHSNGLTQVNFNRNGTRLYSIRNNRETQDHGQARAWRADTGSPDSPPLELESMAALYAAEFATDDQSLLTLATDGTVTRWAAGDWRARVLLPANTNTTARALSPDGLWFAYATTQRDVWIADTEAGRVLVGPLAIDEACANLSVDPGGSLLLAIGNGGRLQLWAAPSGLPLATNSAVAGVQSAWFSPTATRLLVQQSAIESRLFTVTNLAATGIRFTNYEPLSSPFRTGDEALVLRYDRAWGVWDPLTGVSLGDACVSIGVVEDAAWSPDGQRVVVSDSHPTALIAEFSPPAPTARSVGLVSVSDLSPDGRWAVVMTTNTAPDGSRAPAGEVVTVLDVASGEPAGEPWRHPTRVTGWGFNPSGEQLATIATDSKVRVWSVGAGVQRDIGPLTNVTTDADPVFSPDGRRMGIRGLGGWWLVDLSAAPPTVESFKSGAGVKVKPQWGDSSAVHDLQFSPDGGHVATGLETGVAELWDLTSRTRKALLKHEGPVWSVRFSPDGQKVLTSSFDGTAMLSSTATGQRLLTLVHGLSIERAIFTPRGRHVITLGADWAARIWEAETGVLLGTAKAPNDQVRAIEVGPGGDCFVTFSARGFLQLWDTETVTPLSEPVGGIWRRPGVRFTTNGRLLAVAVTKHAVVEIDPLRPTAPAPDWLPRLAEALTGLVRSRDAGSAELVPTDLLALRREISSLPGSDFYSRWGRWFFAAPAQRGRPPLSGDR